MNTCVLDDYSVSYGRILLFSSHNRNYQLNFCIHLLHYNNAAVSGPPGSGKLTQCQRVIKRYKKYRWVHLSIGDLLRQQMIQKGDAETKWQVIRDLVHKGMAGPDWLGILDIGFDWLCMMVLRSDWLVYQGLSC